MAASKINRVERRGFQAQMTLKYCQGRARLAQTVFDWGRENIELGLPEKRTGIICVGLESAFTTAKRCQEKQPLMALFLRQIAESDSQQDPIFKTSIAYTRLTATSALEKLKEQGFTQEQLP
ncbi:MAG: transposase, partial [Richelia sp.]|nr:transposase [Richelia sp.]